MLISGFLSEIRAQWVLPPDRNVTGRMGYYYNTMIVHLELLEDGRFRMSGQKSPFSSIHWQNITPYFLEGRYVENPPGNIVLIDSIDREHYFWIPIGYTANRDINGHPVVTAKYSDRQARSFPYSQRFGLVSGIAPEAIIYADGSVKYRFLYFHEPFPELIRKYISKEPGKMYPGIFGKFKKNMLSAGSDS